MAPNVGSDYLLDALFTPNSYFYRIGDKKIRENEKLQTNFFFYVNLSFGKYFIIAYYPKSG
jgi:hypothetical protein